MASRRLEVKTPSQTTTPDGRPQTGRRHTPPQTAPPDGRAQAGRRHTPSQTAPPDGRPQTGRRHTPSQTAPPDGRPQTGRRHTPSQTAPPAGRPQPGRRHTPSQTARRRRQAGGLHTIVNRGCLSPPDARKPSYNACRRYAHIHVVRPIPGSSSIPDSVPRVP
ncbi:MAG: hypothetical protein K2L75_03545, partial [Muribaculaceae bacterium]|nr:hypothetical protein [Muribaculaceae bacterium]